MATTTTSVTFHTRIDDYAVVELLQDIDLEVGQSFTLTGVGHGLNGTYPVRALPQIEYLGTDSEGDFIFDYDAPILNQVLFYDEGDNLDRSAAIPVGTITTSPTCTWVTDQQIEDWLGFTSVSVADAAFLVQCAAAANAFCYRRREEAGYVDSLTTSPSGDVTLGTIMYGGALYRQRSSVNEFASFTEMGTATPTGLSAIMKQLLGIPRPAVA
jgi:hypothetical protein